MQPWQLLSMAWPTWILDLCFHLVLLKSSEIKGRPYRQHMIPILHFWQAASTAEFQSFCLRQLLCALIISPTRGHVFGIVQETTKYM